MHTAPIEAKDGVTFCLGTRDIACANTPNFIIFFENTASFKLVIQYTEHCDGVDLSLRAL